jgi:hypothetical protein
MSNYAAVRYEDTEREIEDLRRTNEGVKSELAATRSIQSSLPQLRANVAELDASNDRLLKTEQDLLAARESLNAKLEKETKLAAERGMSILAPPHAVIPPNHPSTPYILLQSASWSDTSLPLRMWRSDWDLRSSPPRMWNAWRSESSSCVSNTSTCGTMPPLWSARWIRSGLASSRLSLRYVEMFF